MTRPSTHPLAIFVQFHRTIAWERSQRTSSHFRACETIDSKSVCFLSLFSFRLTCNRCPTNNIIVMTHNQLHMNRTLTGLVDPNCQRKIWRHQTILLWNIRCHNVPYKNMRLNITNLVNDTKKIKPIWLRKKWSWRTLKISRKSTDRPHCGAFMKCSFRT